MKRYFFIAAFSALAVGCATYTENGLFGGFSETPLASDTYRIQANGNAYTSRSKTNAIAMVRAADLALQHGYDSFIILDYDEWANTAYYTTPTTATTDSTTNTILYAHGSAYDVGSYRHANIYGNANSRTTSTTTIDHGETYTIEKPRTDMVVRFVPNSTPEAARALHVADIINRYGKMAGYNAPPPAETFAEQQSAVFAKELPADAAQPVAPPRLSAAARPLPAPAPQRRDPPTLDEVYKSLSASEKARVNRLPPAQRAEYLEQIRERHF